MWSWHRRVWFLQEGRSVYQKNADHPPAVSANCERLARPSAVGSQVDDIVKPARMRQMIVDFLIAIFPTSRLIVFQGSIQWRMGSLADGRVELAIGATRRSIPVGGRYAFAIWGC